MKRQGFIQQTGFGLAMSGATGLVLRSDAQPTPQSLDAEIAETTFNTLQPVLDETTDLKPTVSRELGRFYRSGSPYRAKLTPLFESGNVLVVTGRVWSFETKKPLANVMLDLW